MNERDLLSISLQICPGVMASFSEMCSGQLHASSSVQLIHLARSECEQGT